jgi:hypothetical protein
MQHRLRRHRQVRVDVVPGFRKPALVKLDLVLGHGNLLGSEDGTPPGTRRARASFRETQGDAVG